MNLRQVLLLHDNFFNLGFIYLFILRDREHESGGRDRGRGEKES